MECLRAERAENAFAAEKEGRLKDVNLHVHVAACVDDEKVQDDEKVCLEVVFVS
jgi:hypothetical protein